MSKIRSFLCAVTALLGSNAVALDASLESSFGKNRVKIQRLEAPQDISAMKMQNIRARHDVRLRECREKSDRNKQYCLQEAANQLMIDERRARDTARKAVQE